MNRFEVELPDDIVELLEAYVRDVKEQSARSRNDDKQNYSVEQAIAGCVAARFKPFIVGVSRL